MNLGEVRQLSKGRGIAKGNIDEAVVGEGGEGGNNGSLLATTGTGSGDENTSWLAVQLACVPELAGAVPEGLQTDGHFSPHPNMNQKRRIYAYLPLTWEVTETSGDADKEAIVVSELLGGDDLVGWLGGCMQLGQNVRRESLGDPVDAQGQTRVSTGKSHM